MWGEVIFIIPGNKGLLFYKIFNKILDEGILATLLEVCAPELISDLL